MNDFYQEPGFGSMISEMTNGAPPLFNVFFFGIFGIIILVIIVVIAKGIQTWTSNNASELLRRPCKVVDKRTKVWGGSGDSRANTSYYLTFEFEDLSRKELQVKPEQYGLIVAGDVGEVLYQGTRFKEFNRTRHHNKDNQNSIHY